jgi:Na+/H+-translocating membrane pyrophosphatase
MEAIAALISDGADTFLKAQYLAISVFMVFFAIVIALVVER